MRALAAALLLAAAASASAQPQSLVDLFERRSIESRGLTMSYGLFVPDGYDPEVAYPLVLAFHGLGESGTDLANLERHRLATSWVEPARQAEHPAFVLAPQTLRGRRWTSDQDPDASAFTTVELVALDLLALVEAEYTIDPDRIYAVGLSLGGHATWDVVSRLPDRFAAAVPMSGRGFTSQADDLGLLPVWAFTGETDTVVPPSQTRRVVQAMEDLGRRVVYTDCRRAPVDARQFDCPGPISQDSLAEAVAAHASLIYTSERTTGHGPWAPWFDRALLDDWLFSKVRLDPDAIALTAPASGAVWDGAETVTWTSTRDGAETVEVWVSVDGGRDWGKAGEAALADGAFSVASTAYRDTPLAQVRLFVLNADGRVAGRTTSARFRIDNPGDAAPTLRLDDEALRFAEAVSAETVDLPVTAADPEGAALDVAVRYSADGGASFQTVQTVEWASSPEPRPLALDLGALPNAARAVIEVSASDGASTAAVQTAPFAKTTPRAPGDPAEQVEGDGAGTVAVRVVDADALTGHRYRVTFSADGGATAYAVTDVTEGRAVLSGVPLSDGTAESPVFDGLALVVERPAEGTASSTTGWTEGDTDLDVTVSGGTIRIAILTIDLLATEDDYTVTLADGVAGQSVARYRIPAQDLRFTVTAASDGAARSVVFDDAGDDGRPGPGDTLYILEPDGEGDLEPAWRLQFSGGTEPPETGDVFRLVPVRSIGPGDVFEFVGRAVVGEDGPGAGVSLAGYPNPFSDWLTVAYRLDRPADVTVEVFDALGRRVARLAEGRAGAGTHRAVWEGAAASGVFVVRLTATPDGGAPRRVHRAVVRVGR
jgi:predicted esterase